MEGDLKVRLPEFGVLIDDEPDVAEREAELGCHVETFVGFGKTETCSEHKLPVFNKIDLEEQPHNTDRSFASDSLREENMEEILPEIPVDDECGRKITEKNDTKIEGGFNSSHDGLLTKNSMNKAVNIEIISGFEKTQEAGVTHEPDMNRNCAFHIKPNAAVNHSTDMTHESDTDSEDSDDGLHSDHETVYIHKINNENMIQVTSIDGAHESDASKSSGFHLLHDLLDDNCRNVMHIVESDTESEERTDESVYNGDDEVAVPHRERNNVHISETNRENVIEETSTYRICDSESEGMSDINYECITAEAAADFSEKECMVAVLGTLLVIMCIEIYTSSNKPVVQTDLIETTDDLGLNWLFQSEEVPACSGEGSESGRRRTSDRSKAARKRKKQQQKLHGRVLLRKERRKNRFAEHFEDLQRPVYEDLLPEVDHSLTCPICLEMYYLPCLCQPCGHIFCDPCLRRLTCHGSEGVLCPLCRTVIQCCVADKDFSEQLMASHSDIYYLRHSVEKKSKYRHFHLPFTPPTPLSQRLMRHLVTNRANIPVNQGTLYSASKLVFGLLACACISILIMLLSHVRGIQSARDVNIMFLSFITGALVTVVFFKIMKI